MSPATVPGLVDAAARSSRPLTSDADPSNRPINGSPIAVLDLFAGAGGLALGFHLASDRFRIVQAVESDNAAAATYDRNFGTGITYVAPVERWLDTEWVPRAQVVIGGPPCQGFSRLGHRRVDDARNKLWRYYAEAVRQSGALFFVMENVPQFLDSPEFGLLQEQTMRGGILEDYHIEASTLNAADFGVPQIRKRAIVIGHRRELRFPGWPEPTHPGPERWLTLRDAWKGLLERPVAPYPVPARKSRPDGTGAYRSDELHGAQSYSDVVQRRFAHIPPGGSRIDLPHELQLDCWRGFTRGANDVMGRLAWDKPSVTLRTGFTKPDKGRFVHPTEDRAITIHEGARIQGFPDDYKFVGSLTAITRQIGNAVPIPLARALGGVIAEKFS